MHLHKRGTLDDKKMCIFASLYRYEKGEIILLLLILIEISRWKGWGSLQSRQWCRTYVFQNSASKFVAGPNLVKWQAGTNEDLFRFLHERWMPSREEKSTFDSVRCEHHSCCRDIRFRVEQANCTYSHNRNSSTLHTVNKCCLPSFSSLFAGNVKYSGIASQLALLIMFCWEATMSPAFQACQTVKLSRAAGSSPNVIRRSYKNWTVIARCSMFAPGGRASGCAERQ